MASSPLIEKLYKNGSIQQKKKLIGSGSYGEVFSIDDDDRYVLKEIMIKDFEKSKTEYEILKANIPHLVRGYGSFTADTRFIYSMERMRFTLREFLHGKINLTFEQYLPIFFDIVKGMYLLVDCEKKVHRDLKPDNILLNSELRAFIADPGFFGEDLDYSLSLKSYAGTIYFMAPEMLDLSKDNKHLPGKLDVYSLGVISLLVLDPDVLPQEEKEKILITEQAMDISVIPNDIKRPNKMKEKNHVSSLDRIKESLGKKVPEKFFELIREMLDVNYNKRKSFKEIYEMKTNMKSWSENYVHRKLKISDPFEEKKISKDGNGLISILKIAPSSEANSWAKDSISNLILPELTNVKKLNINFCCQNVVELGLLLKKTKYTSLAYFFLDLSNIMTPLRLAFPFDTKNYFTKEFNTNDYQLRGKNECSENDLTCLKEILEKNSKIRQLRINFRSVKEVNETNISSFLKNLKLEKITELSLDFSGCLNGDEACENISKFLKIHPKLEILNLELEQTGITAHGIKQLSIGLDNLLNLYELTLKISFNKIGEAPILILLESLKTQISLSSLTLWISETGLEKNTAGIFSKLGEEVLPLLKSIRCLSLYLGMNANYEDKQGIEKILDCIKKNERIKKLQLFLGGLELSKKTNLLLQELLFKDSLLQIFYGLQKTYQGDYELKRIKGKLPKKDREKNHKYTPEEEKYYSVLKKKEVILFLSQNNISFSRVEEYDDFKKNIMSLKKFFMDLSNNRLIYGIEQYLPAENPNFKIIF